MRIKKAFTLLEMIFVIVIVGIIGKFGVEFFVNSYNTFLFSSINNSLQQESESAVEMIATRLQYRIKDSLIARKTDGTFASLSSASGNEYTILEWVGSDIEGFLGNSDSQPNLPNWSGIIDLDLSTKTKLISPATDTDKINTLINILSDGDSSIDDVALYFVGSNNDINGYGWDGNKITNQNQVMHPITSSTNKNQFISSISGVDFSGVDVYEFYKLAWSAYAVAYNTNKNELHFYYDYQPWMGEKYSDAKSSLIMQHVSTFKFVSIDNIIKIQVCVQSDIISNEEYSICKEKVVF